MNPRQETGLKTYGIVGAGGFGREVMPLLREMLGAAPTGAELCFVVEGSTSSAVVNGLPVISLDDFMGRGGERLFNIAIGDSLARERIANALLESGCAPLSVVASNAVVMDGNTIGEGEILCPFTTVTSNASIGRFFHANIYSYVAHDCRIGDFVTFAPGVKCNGNVIVEDHAYVGTGAVIKPGSSANPLVIGRGAVVGMGAVVTRSVAPGTTVAGNPAKVLGG